MDFDTILIIGPQGSGKGTQGRMLAQKLDFLFWEMGGIAREISRENTDLGKQVANIINRGELLSDEIIKEISQEKLATIPPAQGIIFDGIPRRVGQAEFLLNFLKGQNRKKPVTVFLNLPREETFKRLLLRAEKEGRIDDTRDAIEARLRQYEEDTKPTLEYLKQRTRFIEIDGRPSVLEVTREIENALGLPISK